MDVDAILFDKDGTLFGFDATWGPWAETVIVDLGVDAPNGEAGVASALGFDRAAGRFRRDSRFIAGTLRESAEGLARALTGWEVDPLVDRLRDLAKDVPQAEAVPLKPFLQGLHGAGVKLGIVTNDAEAIALLQLRKAEVFDLFGVIYGYDSGHGAKPAPDPINAALKALNVAPDRAVFVGDSTHDLEAARAAGVGAVGVLTGPATRDDLKGMADVVLDDIGQLPDWLSATT